MCLDQGIGIIPYYPLAGGILTGKYNVMDQVPAGSRLHTEPNFSMFLNDQRIALGKNVSRLAGEVGCSASVLSLSWLIGKPAVSTVIVGATKVEQFADNLQSALMTLEQNIVDELDAISDSFRFGNPFAYYRLN